MATWIIVGIAVFISLYAVAIFNRLIALKQTRNNAFADIDVQLKLRHDLIPNLVETVKKYAQHEKEVLENVTTARSNAMRATSINEKSATESILEKAMINLLAVSENYPELKADGTFNKFQDELSAIEKSIAAARRFFNNSTAELNTASQQFPANVVAGIFGMHEQDYFELDEDTKRELEQPLKVQF